MCALPEILSANSFISIVVEALPAPDKEAKREWEQKT